MRARRDRGGTDEGRFEEFVSRFLFQARFLASSVPFYQARYRSLDLSAPQDFSVTTRIPAIRKEDLRSASGTDLIAAQAIDRENRIAIQRSTGGTTGRCLSIMYSSADWAAAVDAHVAALKRPAELTGERIVSFNCYHQGHISGPIFNDAISALGGIPIARHFKSSDEEVLEEMARNRCNTIIAPASSSGKGGALESLLEIDAATRTNFINGQNIKFIITSSTALTSDLIEELRDLGISNIVNCYGSTELMPVGFSCSADRRNFHLVECNTYAFVVNSSLAPVSSGSIGRVMVGRIASRSNDGRLTPSLSSGLLNYMNGDEARIEHGRCECGSAAPRIGDIARVEDRTEKLTSGCQSL